MSLPTSTTPAITPPPVVPPVNPTTTTTSSSPVIITTVPTSAPTQPTNDPNPPPPASSDDPIQSTSKGTGPPKSTKTPKGAGTTGTGTATGPGGSLPSGGGTIDNDKGESSSKSVAGPVIGAIAGVLVIGFFVAVFVMRKRKAAARKRRLDFLGDGNNEPITSGGTGAIGAHRPSSISSTPRLSNQAAHRPMEMASVGAKPLPKLTNSPGYNNNNNHQLGYQQVPVPYGQGDQYQYPDQQYQYQDGQYDPYYAQRQQQQQQQGYYPDQQQGYYEYPDQQQQQQNQFVAPGPLAHSSPSMSNSSAYPPPPPSTITATQSSPRTPLAHAGAPQSAYEKNAKEGYAGTQSPARNPQMVPEPEEAIKVPVS
ncbi:hypothetical protein CPC16_002297 [Podila verticillata]|uniref:Uncharacterized protein n=1 Tax=Podila verticillata NRRL 6337 TaxID=1069443 RepID=A0A086TK55_9FUNG|nr:hypothetical protein BGZ59_002476 [Podila verticillata]KAF9372688.1 hypothetical protein CPC16_002297 [Podila verticillata]KAI9231698.1 MAG: hypothetical protein BYD32DRAFT_466918 [Podila humilis]KFH62332.1 hypothetical protein MVEG_11543 [Podila verticillata NRRL 6337]